ncbi:hypothetical protein [Pseudoalteromonas ruthenica]|uniref:hypothetical protein n=1 Tax=Pseudoalteromonas ruthenica TaxID=151081 RepID=UPI00241CFD06|nr:hypothetical protein [Pseudoalteromonas ruthenica]|tara:strand:+ start:50400 stop:50720 length:321 start_codon:yes stop_codon:yes gene_type:complete
MEEQIQKMYRLVFGVAKHFLEQFQLFTIEELAEHDEPTYAEIAGRAKRLAEIMTVFAEHGDWSSERVALNAKQAALHMERMALAISEENNEELEQAAQCLQKMDFI